MHKGTWLVGCSVLVVVIAAASSFPRPARASCASPPPEIIWSYPAAGDVDVPLDADLLLLTNGDWTSAVVLLDDREVTAENDVPGHYDLGSLEARTEHTITVKDLTDASGTRTLEDLTWTFTTGDAELEAPDSSTLRVVSSSTRVNESPQDGSECSNALFANSCFDTGTPNHDTVEVETEAEVVLWIIELVTESRDAQGWNSLPAECGDPQLLTTHSRPFGEDPRYRIHGVLRDGTIITSEDVAAPTVQTPDAGTAPAPRTPDAGTSPASAKHDDGGCSTAGSASTAASWLVLVALLSRRRRRIG